MPNISNSMNAGYGAHGNFRVALAGAIELPTAKISRLPDCRWMRIIELEKSFQRDD